MLTDDIIICVIKEYEREYAICRKDSNAFHEKLAKKILNTVDDEKEQIMDFFLREIKSNEYGLCVTALMLIQEIKAVELCPHLVDIYKEVSAYKDEEWKKNIILVLMELRYSPPKELYQNYVLEYLNLNKNSFYLLVQYCNVNPQKALLLLSNELVENILSEELLTHPPEKIGNSLQGINVLIGFLIASFKNNPNDYLPELLKLVYKKKAKAAIYLKSALINYLSNDFAKRSYSQYWLDKEIEHLNKQSFFESKE